MEKYNLLIPCASGMESLVAKEIKDLGYDYNLENGYARLEGDLSDIAKLNINLRIADRVKILLGEFKVTNFDELFDQTYALPFEDFLPMDAQFPVAGKCIKSKLHAVSTCQKLVKKAIASKLQFAYHRRAALPENGALYPITIHIRKDIAHITLDTTGNSLFKRGYRLHKGPAPLKENMAAALVALTNWTPNRPFLDPTCGSGTIAIEAARMALHIAPGIKRQFLCENWRIFSSNIFSQARKEAKDKQRLDQTLDIVGCDIDQRMIEIAKENARAADVADYIQFKQVQVADFKIEKANGVIVANPPYGERLKDKTSVHKLYQEMGEKYRPLESWSKYILTSDLNFEDYYGLKATKRRKLYNGALRTDFFQYWAQNNSSKSTIIDQT